MHHHNIRKSSYSNHLSLEPSHSHLSQHVPAAYSVSMDEESLSANIGAPMAFAPPIPSHSPSPSPHLQQRSASISKSNSSFNLSPVSDSYEYDVVFTTQSLGLSLRAMGDGMDCMVNQCVNAFSAQNVEKGSIVTAVNGKNVQGLAYEKIRDYIKENAAMPPLTLTFRAKMNGSGYKQTNNVNERGLLGIKIVACMQLKHAARYVEVKVGGVATLRTRELKRNNHHPEWDELLKFNNFRADHGKKAMVTVYDTSAILKDKKIGSVEYELPVKFGEMKKETLELKTSKGKVCGVIIMNVLITAQDKSYGAFVSDYSQWK